MSTALGFGRQTLIHRAIVKTSPTQISRSSAHTTPFLDDTNRASESLVCTGGGVQARGRDGRWAPVVSELITELETLFREEKSDILTLSEAALYSGYSVDHLGRSLRRGSIENVGARGRPRVRRGDLPRKSGALRNEMSEPIVAVNTRRQIAQSVVTSTHERHDG